MRVVGSRNTAAKPSQMYATPTQRKCIACHNAAARENHANGGRAFAFELDLTV
ncbi:hypothetical protein J2793_003872 [Paraburkholderia caledonica]|uniref:Doubled CXXCH motif domain-containing protein n=1 Tax=Paraburkholderia caledonica TaxID=134536 RepID=A0AB73IEF7_9BURK|nr:hypothetical protein [Paraburkholderia caledonica]